VEGLSRTASREWQRTALRFPFRSVRYASALSLLLALALSPTMPKYWCSGLKSAASELLRLQQKSPRICPKNPTRLTRKIGFRMKKEVWRTTFAKSRRETQGIRWSTSFGCRALPFASRQKSSENQTRVSGFESLLPDATMDQSD